MYWAVLAWVTGEFAGTGAFWLYEGSSIWEMDIM